MYYVDLSNQTEVTLDDIRKRHPNASIPTGGDCASLGYARLQMTPTPAYDDKQQGVRLARPAMINEVWQRQWEVYPLPAEDVAAHFERLRADKIAAINQARVRADSSHFSFGGKQVQVDDASMRQIMAVTGYISLWGDFPPGFPGAWKAMDNTYIPLVDVAAWKDLIKAMATQGVENFAKQQTLKAEIAKAASMAAVEAINWDAENKTGV